MEDAKRQTDYNDVNQSLPDVKELVGLLSRIKLVLFLLLKSSDQNGNFDK